MIKAYKAKSNCEQACQCTKNNIKISMEVECVETADLDVTTVKSGNICIFHMIQSRVWADCCVFIVACAKMLLWQPLAKKEGENYFPPTQHLQVSHLNFQQ